MQTIQEEKVTQIAECVTCRDNPTERVCFHGLPMWAVVKFQAATKVWVDLHGHAHAGHKLAELPGTKLQIIITKR